MEKQFFIVRHPESKIIFDLADMLAAARYPIYFSFVDYGDCGEFDGRMHRRAAQKNFLGELPAFH